MLIIIIGLPGSGKSHLCKIFEKAGFIVYDDFITHFYNRKLLMDIESSLNLCVCDPRLCIGQLFDKFINLFMEHIDKSQIHLILFKNDYEKCLNNVKNRHCNKKGICETIIQYSGLYNINFYNEYNNTIIDVFDNNQDMNRFVKEII